MLQKKGELDQAEPIWQLLLDMKRQTRGSQTLECANIQTQLALIHQRRGDMKAAEMLYRQSVETCKEVLGERHPEYAVSLTNLGLLLQRANDFQGAESALRQALAIRKEVLSPRHPDYATSLINLAQLEQKRGDTTWARMLLKEAVEVRLALFGEQNIEYAHSLAALAEVYAQQGDLTKAHGILRQAHEIRRRALGANHPVIAGSLSNLAGVHRKLGDFNGAEDLLRESLQIRKETIGEEHPDYATNLGNLAWLLQRKGDREGAEELLMAVLNIRRKLLGEKHPDYQQSLERLKHLQGSAPTPAIGKKTHVATVATLETTTDTRSWEATSQMALSSLPDSVPNQQKELSNEANQSVYSGQTFPALARMNEFFASNLAYLGEDVEDVAEEQVLVHELDSQTLMVSPEAAEKSQRISLKVSQKWSTRDSLSRRQALFALSRRPFPPFPWTWRISKAPRTSRLPSQSTSRKSCHPGALMRFVIRSRRTRSTRSSWFYPCNRITNHSPASRAPRSLSQPGGF